MKSRHEGLELRMVKQTKLKSSGMKIPDWAYDSLARSLLPELQKYYESEIGRKDLEEYRAEKARKALGLEQNKETKGGFGNISEAPFLISGLSSIKRTQIRCPWELRGSDYLVLVELRGFEPLTPAMRTQCSPN